MPIRTGEPASCGPETCRLQTATGTVAIIRNASAAGDCDGLVLLVSAEPARGECPSHVTTLDRFTVWRDGAHAVWLTAAGPVVLSDRQYRGARPWVPLAPTARRTIPNLPMAVEEAPATLD